MKDPVVRFMEHVQVRPEHPAVIQETGSVTYGAIGSKARRIASAISAVCENPRVIVHLPQGADAYAAMFGALMAGGYYSPINMDAPIQRHLEILHQFRPHVVVSTKELASELPLVDIDAVFVDIDELPHDELAKPLTAHEIAYVIFTSGSTGQPKGVVIPRSAIAHYTQWAITEMQVSPDDRWSQHPNIAFDLSVLDIYGALCGGATLYPLTSKKDRLLPANFIKQHQLTIWNSVPSVIDLMTKARQVTEQNLQSLRLITFCGEPLYQRHLDAIFSANATVMVHNTYGPTEATVSCSLIRLTSDNFQDFCDNSVALGHAIAGMEFELVGGTSEEGELVLLGEQLALGYWENEPETERVFKPITIHGETKRSYYTGDWVVKRGGEYYFAGRIDSQVKIRGNRVELDEIDLNIFKLGYGKSCTVIANEQLHSFIETSDLPDYAEFKTSLSAHLPEYEIPAYIYAVKDFPRNNNDKIDRKSLVETIG